MKQRKLISLITTAALLFALVGTVWADCCDEPQAMPHAGEMATEQPCHSDPPENETLDVPKQSCECVCATGQSVTGATPAAGSVTDFASTSNTLSAQATVPGHSTQPFRPPSTI